MGQIWTNIQTMSKLQRTNRRQNKRRFKEMDPLYTLRDYYADSKSVTVGVSIANESYKHYYGPVI
jgi:hypothetical protein